MRKYLITGASGNIGFEIIRGLNQIGVTEGIVAADYKPDHARTILKEFRGLEYRRLDFTDPSSFSAALDGIDVVFLLRPPNLADVPKYFGPFVDAMLAHHITKIVFLSVQGVEHQKRIPHHKIEKLILEKGLEYAFLRPSYFMQNLTTTLVREIRHEDRIFIPSGKLEFTWVDARDIGLTGAHILKGFERYKQNAYEITGYEIKSFGEVAAMLSAITGRNIRYESPNLLKFFRKKRAMGMQPMMIFVMIMLHYLPRFNRRPNHITHVVRDITGKSPGTLDEFMRRELQKFDPGKPVR